MDDKELLRAAKAMYGIQQCCDDAADCPECFFSYGEGKMHCEITNQTDKFPDQIPATWGIKQADIDRLEAKQ